MADATIDALIVDLLIWLEIRERTYPEVMDAWKTSCPRLTVWEDANDRKLIATSEVNGREIVQVTPAGSEFLRQRRTLRKNPATPEPSRPA